MFTQVRRSLARIASLSLAVFLILSTVPPALVLAAGSLTVSGTVTNQSGGGVLNVSVYATAPGGSTALYGPTTTNSGGAYSLGIDAGTYDIHFDPPGGSGLNPIIQTNYVVSANQTLNVQLTSLPHTISGTLRDGNGNPVSSLTLVFRLTSTGVATNTVTNANGHYSTTLNAGMYYLAQVTGTAPAPIGSVNVSALYGGGGMPQLDLTNGDLTQDFTLPTTILNVTVKDSNGNLLPGAPVTISGNTSDNFSLTGGAANYYNGTTRSGATNSSGVAAMTVFTGTYNPGLICATVSSVQVCNSSSIAISGVSNLTLQPAPTHVLSGTLRDGNGNPVSSLTMIFRLTSTGVSTNVITDVNGHYAATLSAGAYYLSQVTGTAPAPIGSVNVSALYGGGGMPQLDLTSGDLTQDFTLPTTTINVTVKDNAGNLISGAPVSISGNTSDNFSLTGGTPNYYNGTTRSGTTNSSGIAAMTAFTGTYNPGLICATISGGQVCNSNPLTVSGATNLTLQQPPQHVLSGTLRDGNGNPVSSLTLVFRLTSTGVSTNATTDASGHYSVTLNAGAYYLSQVTGTAPAPIGSVNVSALYGGGGMPQLDLSSSDRTQDFTLPTTTLNVTVKDGYGIPVSGAPVTISGNTSDNFSLTGGTPNYYNGTTRSASTNSSGSAVITAFTGTYNNGLICTAINNTQVCNNTPLTVSGPTTLLFQAAPQAPPAPTGLTSFNVLQTATYNGHTYYLLPSTDWTTAEKYAQALGGHLATINDDAENTFVYNTFTANGTINRGLWIGLNDAAVEGTFVWASGDPVSFTKFAAGEPNNNGGNEDYVHIFYPSDSRAPYWNDAPNSAAPFGVPFYGVVEIPNTTVNVNPPILSWNSVSVAANYNIYRNSTKIGSTATTSFGDTTVLLSGSYTYTVTAVSALNVESSASSPTSVTYSGQGPLVSNVQINPSTISVNQTATLSASVSDSFSTVTNAEYFEGTDPGAGNGTPMAIVAGVASAMLPNNLAVGSHTFTVRAKNSLGIWTTGTLPTATLTVTLPVLNGKVLNGANIGISGVSVAVVNPSDHSQVVATTTTDSNGNYAVTITTPGTYDVLYTPAGNTYAPVTKTGINLMTSNTVDVVLVLAPRVFSGMLTDQNNVGIRGATISLHNAGGQTVTSTTDDNGNFSATVNQATYSVTISGTKAAAPSAYIPASFSLSGGSFDLTNNVTHNFTISAVTAALTTRSALTGAAVGSVGLSISTTTSTLVDSTSSVYTGSANYTVTTDGSGNISVVLLAGTTYSIVATPPANTGTVTTSFPADGPKTGDFQRDLLLTADIRHFTGTFTNNMAGIPGATIRLSGVNGTFQATTDTNGAFDVTVAAGSYALSVSGTKPSNSNLAIPDSYGFTGDSIDLSTSDVTRDLTFDTTSVTVTAASSFGAVLPGVNVTLTSAPGNASLYLGGTLAASATSSGTTDSNGQVTLYVTRCLAYATKAVPASGSGYTTTELPAGNTVCAPTSWNVVMNRDLQTFQGIVADINNHAVAGATVRLDGNQPDEHYSTLTDQNGNYTLQVAPYSAYSLQISGTQAAAPDALLPDNYTLSTTVSVTGATTKNITVAAVPVDIYARDDRLNPIANVAVNFSSNGSQGGLGASSSTIARITDQSGHAYLNMLTGTTYTISATPPANQGYVATVFNGTSPITQATQVIIQFQNHIPLAPICLHAATPTNIKPELSWCPVDGADHYAVYRDGVQVGTSSSAAFTDANLATDGSYGYQISAVSADNYESPKSDPFQVVYDTTPPALHYTLSANPNAAGWNNGPVTVTYSCADALSGMASCPSSVTETADGIYDLTATATDTAGNTVTITPEIKVDQTLPDISYQVVPHPNAHGWNRTDVTVSFSCQDATSGIASCSPPVTLTNEGANQMVTGTAVDNAGNLRTITATVNIDKTAPGISATLSQAPNANGWNNAPVTVSYTCTDALSGVASCPADQAESADGSFVLSAAATDNADNSSAELLNTVNIDQTAPTITYTVTPLPNSNGWNNADVLVTFTCHDDTSGIASCTPPQTVSTEGASQAIVGTAVDKAGNTSHVTATINLDKTPPTIIASVSPAPNSNGWNKGDATVSFTCSDALSGVATCPGPVTVSAETAATGQTVSGTATDNAGNTASASVTIKLDKTAPAVTSMAWTTNPLMQGQNTTLSATSTDALSGISSMYFTIDGGQPQPMAYDAASSSWKATFGSNLAVNTYNVEVFAVDNAGNIGDGAMDVLAVTNSANGHVSGHAWLVPSATDTLPIPRDTTTKHPTKLVVGFSGQQGATTSVDAHYVIQNNQNEFDFSSTTVNWVVVPDGTHASILVHGDLTTYVNGIQTVTTNVAMRLDIVLGSNGSADQISMKLWNPGLNPSTDAPTYVVSDYDLPNQSQVMIH